MTASTTYDSTPFSAATTTQPARRPNPFTDATVVDSQSFSSQQVTLKLLPSHTREDGHFEISDALGVSEVVRTRLQNALDQINSLLGEPATADTDVLDSAVAIRALEHVWRSIANVDMATEVFPLSDGGLLFRWRTARGAVEAEFDADGDTIVMIDDTDRDDRRAGYSDELWSDAAPWLREQ